MPFLIYACRKLKMPLKANPINPLIKANIICLFWHFGCTFVSLFSNLGKINPISFFQNIVYCFLHNIPLDVYTNTYME